MFNNFSIRKELIICFISMILTLFFSISVLNIWNSDLNVPFAYHGDVFGSLNAAQNFITGNGRYNFPNMGAPGEVFNDFPDSSNIQYFFVWFMSIFIKNSTLLINIFYILTYPAVALTTTIALRLLKISPFVSIIGGVLFSLLPYHFMRGEPHLFLSTYGEIPLLCVVIIWIMNNEIKFSKPKKNEKKFRSFFSIFNYRIVVTIITCALTASSNPYYTFFALLFIVFVTIYVMAKEKNKMIKKLYMPIFIVGIIILFLIINFIPMFHLSNNITGIESLSLTRTLTDADIYSLRIGQLILPVDGHRLSFMEFIKNKYNMTFSQFINENKTATLGLIMTIGFIISLFKAFFVPISSKNLLIHQAGLLNIYALVLSMTGGIASLLVFFQQSIRSYNRISLFIAFFSLLVICLLIDRLREKLKKDRIKSFVNIGIVIICVVGVLDQSPKSFAVNISANSDLYYSNVKFVKDIERITTVGGMVFELPLIPPERFTDYKKMGVYELFYPFVHSTNLKWSYRPNYLSKEDKWQKSVAALPTEKMLNKLALARFTGIYIDRFGYEADEFKKLEHELSELTGKPPIISDNQRMSYFNIEEYSRKIESKYTKEEWSNLQKKALMDGHLINIGETIKVGNNSSLQDLLESGWSGVEPWGRWSDSKKATLNFVVDEESKDDLIMEFNTDIFAPLSELNFSVSINNVVIEDFSLGGGTKTFSIAIPLKNLEENKGKVNVVFDIKNPISPAKANLSGDSRMIGIGLKDIVVTKSSASSPNKMGLNK